jgi:hypothetical protein
LIRLITESERIARMQIETVLEDGKRMFAPSIEGYLREKALRRARSLFTSVSSNNYYGCS